LGKGGKEKLGENTGLITVYPEEKKKKPGQITRGIKLQKNQTQKLTQREEGGRKKKIVNPACCGWGRGQGVTT